MSKQTSTNTDLQLTSQWGILVFRGVVSLLLAILLISWPYKSLMVAAWLVGLFLLIEGIMVAIGAIIRRKNIEHWGLVFSQGLLTVGLGLIISVYPQITIGVLYFMFALWVVIGGILLLVEAVRQRKEVMGLQWLFVVGGVISLLFAYVLLSQPQATMAISMMIFGVILLLNGVLQIAYGMQVRSFEHDLRQLAV